VIKRLRKPPYNTQINHPERNQRLGRRLEAQRKRSGAVGFDAMDTVYRGAIAREPGDWVLHDLRATFLATLGKDREAEEEYREVIRLVPHHALACYRLGLLFSDRDPAASEAWQRKAVALRPDFADAHQELGRTLAKQARPDEAGAELALALKLKPELVDARLLWASILRQGGRREEAAGQYRKVLETRPDLVEAQFELGVIQLELSQIEEAAARFSEVLRLDPRHQLAAQHLEKTRRLLKEKEGTPSGASEVKR